MENKTDCIIFIGMQASGKTTFYKERFFRTHMHINLDMLQTRKNEKTILDACIQARIPFVIDNTNPTHAIRCAYIETARTNGFRVIAYYFDTEMESAVERNDKRPSVERVPIKAMLKTHDSVELPDYTEGIDELWYVRNDNCFVVTAWDNRNG